MKRKEWKKTHLFFYSDDKVGVRWDSVECVSRKNKLSPECCVRTWCPGGYFLRFRKSNSRSFSFLHRLYCVVVFCVCECVVLPIHMSMGFQHPFNSNHLKSVNLFLVRRYGAHLIQFAAPVSCSGWRKKNHPNKFRWLRSNAIGCCYFFFFANFIHRRHAAPPSSILWNVTVWLCDD